MEEASEDKECEKGVIYDEDEDGCGEVEINLDEESDDVEDSWELESDGEEDHDLYETKLDKVDDILFVKEKLDTLQQVNGQHYQAMLTMLSGQEQQGLLGFFEQA